MFLTKENSVALLSSLMLFNAGLSDAAPASNSTSHHSHKHKHPSKRDGTCAFPNYDGMVAVQTSGLNAGWAMHYDQQCSFGSWCPYACKPCLLYTSRCV